MDIFDTIGNTGSRSDIFDTIKPDTAKTDAFDKIEEPKQKPKVNLKDVFKASVGVVPYKMPQDEATATKQAALQGLFGVTPDRPDLQSKYPVKTFATKAVTGVAPYLTGGGPAALLTKFAIIPAAREFVRQSTDLSEENKNLKGWQRAAKVGTAGALGYATGRVFQGADILKTVAKRVLTRSGAGLLSGAESVLQDMESGRDPDIKQALYNSALSSLMIGTLGLVAEVPSLRGAVMREANLLRETDPANVLIKGKPAPLKDYGKAVEYLKMRKVDPESLSPVLKQAIASKSSSQVMKNMMKNKPFGSDTKLYMNVLKEKSSRTRLNLIDELIYKKVKSATGREPSFDWRTGLDYKLDYSKMNPRVKSEIQTLINFRKEISKGADPAMILMKMEALKKTTDKQYIAEVLKRERDISSLYKKQAPEIKPTLKPTKFFAKGEVEVAGKTFHSRPLLAPNPSQVKTATPYIQKALDSVKESQMEKEPSQRKNIPPIETINNLHRDYLVRLVNKEMEKNSSEAQIIDKLHNAILKDFPRRYSFVTSHTGREESPRIMIYDWKNLRNVEMAEAAKDLKIENYLRKQKNMPEITFNDIEFMKDVFAGQPKGVIKQTKEAFIREYKRADIGPLIDEIETEGETVPAPAPVSPDAGVQKAKELIEAFKNVSAPEPSTRKTMPSKQSIEKELSLLGLNDAQIDKVIKTGNVSGVVDELLGKIDASGVPDNIEIVENTNGSRSMVILPEAKHMSGQVNIGTQSHSDAVAMARDQGIEDIIEILNKYDVPPPVPTTPSEEEQAMIMEKAEPQQKYSGPPSQEKVEEQKYTRDAEVIKEEQKRVVKVVEQKHSVYSLQRLARRLYNRLGRQPSYKEFMEATGLSEQEVRDIRAGSFEDVYPEVSKEEWEKVKVVDGDVHIELNAVLNTLDELYASMSTRNYEDAINLLERGVERIKTSKRKFVYKSLFLSEKARKKQFEQFKSMGIGNEPKSLDPELIKFINQKKFKEIQWRINDLRRMAAALVKERPFLMETYLNEINKNIEGMSRVSQTVAKEALRNLKKTSDPEDVLYSMQYLKEEMRKYERDMSFKLSDAERDGGATFTLLEKTTINTDQGKLELLPGDYDWFISADKASFLMAHQGQNYIIPSVELSGLMARNILKVGWERYAKGHTEEQVEVEKEPWELKENPEAGFVALPPSAFERWKVKILRHTPLEREAPMPLVVRFIMNNKWASNIADSFKTPQSKAKKESQHREFWKAPEEGFDLLFDARMYEDSVKMLARVDLQPILDDVLENVKNFTGKKKKEEYQEVLDVYSDMMAVASQEVQVNAYDPNNYGWTLLGDGPHKSQEEAEAYRVYINDMYNKFNIPPQDRIPDADLLAGRKHVIWDLLVHPNVMNNNSLHKAILFYKAQLEMPFLEAQLKLGIYSNSDIWKTVQEGYHKKGWDLKGAQLVGSQGSQGPLAPVKRPQREIRSQEEFLQRGAQQGWVPVNDFFNDNFNYIVDAFRGIKQAQLLKEFLKLPLGGPIEYESENLKAINAKHPSPYNFNAVENVISPVIVKEAERISKLSGEKIEPQRVLQEGGWIQGRSEYGLDKWYRGSFYPPYIYKSVYDQIKTLWMKEPSFDDLKDLAKGLQYAKFSLTVVPTDQVSQYIGNILLDRPKWQVIPYLIGILPRTFFHAARGFKDIGPKIKAGEYSPTSVGRTETEVAWTRLFIESGMTAIAGYRSYLNHLVDKVDRGMFPQRQDKKDDYSDFMWSFLGSNHAVMSEMVAHDVLEAAIRMAENKVSEGFSVEEAAKYTSHYMNTAVWQLHRASWQGGVGGALRNVSISRNFLIVPFRILALILRASPFGELIKPYVRFRTATGGMGGKPQKLILNTVLATDIPERYAEELGHKFLGMLISLLIAELTVKSMLQYSFSFMDDGIKDEHGETGYNADGSLNLAAKKRFMVFNPPGYRMTARAFRNVNGRLMALDFGAFKLTKSLGTIMASVVNNFIKVAFGKDAIIGGGILQYLGGKIGPINTILELFNNRDSWTGEEIFDRNEPIMSLDNAKRVIKKGSEGVRPIQPFVGENDVPLSKNKVVDAILKVMELGGVGFRQMPPYAGKISMERYQKDAAKVRTEALRQREATEGIRTMKELMKRLKEGEMSPQTIQNRAERIVAPVGSFYKRNQKAIQKFNSRQKKR